MYYFVWGAYWRCAACVDRLVIKISCYNRFVANEQRIHTMKHTGEITWNILNIKHKMQPTSYTTLYKA